MMADDVKLALSHILDFQPKAIAEIRKRDLVFDKAPFGPNETEADHWQHLAFWLYTFICEADQIARMALDEEGLA